MVLHGLGAAGGPRDGGRENDPQITQITEINGWAAAATPQTGVNRNAARVESFVGTARCV